jgi:hypothetical protein
MKYLAPTSANMPHSRTPYKYKNRMEREKLTLAHQPIRKSMSRRHPPDVLRRSAGSLDEP